MDTRLGHFTFKSEACGIPALFLLPHVGLGIGAVEVLIVGLIVGLHFVLCFELRQHTSSSFLHLLVTATLCLGAAISSSSVLFCHSVTIPLLQSGSSQTLGSIRPSPSVMILFCLSHW
jgi:hypothetical protein